MILLDANVFLRLLTNDDPVKATARRELFARIASGRVAASTCEAIVSEVAPAGYPV